MVKKTGDMAKKTGGRVEEVRAATEIIGRTAEERLRWVTAFARAEMRQHPGELAVDADCLVALAWPVPPYTAVPAPLSRETVETLHAELRRIFRDLVTRTDGATEFPVAAPVRIMRMTVVHGKPALWASTTRRLPTDPRTAILLTVRDLVIQGGERLLDCLECKGAFVARKRQDYCTDLCAQRARNTRNAPTRRKGVPRRKGGPR